jgi:hypothetical protein
MHDITIHQYETLILRDTEFQGEGDKADALENLGGADAAVGA